MTSDEPVTKRTRIVAPKGLAVNNPFRKLGAGVKGIILSMANGPTPSALAIKEAGLRCNWNGGYLAARVRPQFGAFFLEGFNGRELERTIVLTFSRVRQERFNPALGVVVTPTWTRLRQRYEFEDSLAHMHRMATKPWRYWDEI